MRNVSKDEEEIKTHIFVFSNLFFPPSSRAVYEKMGEN
jgi:hypothetical protein